jgi:hypothetical protein
MGALLTRKKNLKPSDRAMVAERDEFNFADTKSVFSK